MKKLTTNGFMPHSTQVFLVRHGESSFNGMNRIQGHMDSGLTRRGLRQAEKISRRLRGMSITKAYTSDLGRAHSTALIIAGKLKLRLIKDRLIREISLGAWEGLSPEEVNTRYHDGYERWRKSPTRTVIPGAERVPQFHKRVRTRVENIIRRNRGHRILIVTHGGVIASLISHWLRADFDRVLLNIKFDNSGLTLLERTALRTKLHAINDIAHLAKRDLNEQNIFSNAA